MERAIKKLLQSEEICPHESGFASIYKRMCFKCIAEVGIKALEKKD
jgi:hypothetical protein